MNLIKKHWNSYRYALNGIRLAFRSELNMRLHLIGALGVLIANLLLSVTRADWLFTLILVGLVWTAEIFNTAIEKLADRVNKEQDPWIGKVKDLAAGAVLVICITAVICALILYFPYLYA